MARSWKSMREAIEHGRGVERPFCCPVHGDRNASASVNVEKGVWVCYACGASGKTEDGKHDLNYIPLMQDAPIPALPPLAIRYTNNLLGYGTYWATRYGTEVAELFATGVDPVTGRPTVPIHDELGTTVHGFLQRRLPGEEGGKYIYPTGVPVSRLLFGHHLVPSNLELLVLVEGASDVMALHSWGVPSGAAVVGVYGAGLHSVQADLVKGLSPHRVLCAMDADDAGRQANTRSMLHMQNRRVGASRFDWWSQFGVNDPGDLKEDPWKILMAA
jgi:DNA primase